MPGKKRLKNEVPVALFLGPEGSLRNLVAGVYQAANTWFPKMTINAAIEGMSLPPNPEAASGNIQAIVADTNLTALTEEQMKTLAFTGGFEGAVTKAGERLLAAVTGKDPSTIYGTMIYSLDQVRNNKVRLKHFRTANNACV